MKEKKSFDDRLFAFIPKFLVVCAAIVVLMVVSANIYLFFFYYRDGINIDFSLKILVVNLAGFIAMSILEFSKKLFN
ncbi:hypothetical protein A8L34_29580 [Bacillus sp. FJAT-27264]|uniref:hypothetical protein n=1 Tax=Paenibacillus sp. (strain DSM 101736 / FJAT-27264) TaxID=1850362 RepID=UPI000807EC98|nr:hypothetical protein [Bacillus sp. FJAT-27264]OBZ15168.1 hypothetical protein A8L34_29580 [Bacillus sp. FJAT-27264]